MLAERLLAISYSPCSALPEPSPQNSCPGCNGKQCWQSISIEMIGIRSCDSLGSQTGISLGSKKKKKKAFCQGIQHYQFLKVEARQFPQQPLRLLKHYKDISFMKASIRRENLLAKSIPQRPTKSCLFSPVFFSTGSPCARFVIGVLGSPPHIKSGAPVSPFGCGSPARDAPPRSPATSGTLAVLAVLGTGWWLQGRAGTGFPLNCCICAFLLAVTVFKHINTEYNFLKASGHPRQWAYFLKLIASC